LQKSSSFLHIFIFILVFTVISKAQDDGKSGMPPEGKGKISGIVVDKDNNHPLEAATILVFISTDSVKVTGTQTDNKGLFSVELQYGKYRIEISDVGYNMATVNGININAKNPEIVLDTIKIKQGSTTTEEIDVTGEKNVIEITPEKKIFNVENSIVSSNGSAIDILRNVPSVSVDNDGNVSLKGSQNVRVLIDGKPVYSSITSVLEGIPASSVESIELITNPSAKYEAEGESGIINVVLKKNSDIGYNGSVILSTGTKDKYNGSVNLNIKNNKLNLFGNYSYQSSRYGFEGTSLRLNNINGLTSSLDQPSTATQTNLSNLGKIGMDYRLTDKQTISLTSTLSSRKEGRNGLETNSFYDNSGILSSRSTTTSGTSETGYNFNAALDYTAKFKVPDKQLSIEASFARSTEETPITLNNQYLTANYNQANNQNWQTYTDQNEKRNVYNLQADYTHPFGKDTKLETGLKSAYKVYDNDFHSQYFDTVSHAWLTDNSLTNLFKYGEFINAVYLIYSDKIRNFGYQAGLRTELTNIKADLLDASRNFTRQYIDFFPSASVSQKLDKTNELELSYSRRVNRPRPGWLNPFGENTDPYNLRNGNPDLKPEYIDSYELSYLKYIKSSVITSSVFLKENHGLISRLKTSIDSITTLTTFVNLSKSYSYGFELIASLQTPKWLSFTGSFSYYNTIINGDNIQSELSTSGHSWYTKFLASLKLWAGFDLQMAYNYQSRRPTIDGYIEPVQAFDISLRKEFTKQNLDISMRVSDVFNTRENRQYQTGDGFIQNITNKRDSRFAYLTLTYRFGTLIEKDKSKKRPKEDNPDEN
jgi:outer membrane receptor protein involved in Fe transport